jgi:Spy/CpxP family protein refolding chaperone
MKRSNLMITISMLAVLLSGIAVGGVGYRLYTVKSVLAPTAPKSPEEFRKKYLEEMQARLKLDSTQVQKLNAILDETRTLWKQEKERNKAELKRIHDSQVDQVRSILTDAQRPVYEQFHREREEKMKQLEKKKQP